LVWQPVQVFAQRLPDLGRDAGTLEPLRGRISHRAGGGQRNGGHRGDQEVPPSSFRDHRRQPVTYLAPGAVLGPGVAGRTGVIHPVLGEQRVGELAQILEVEVIDTAGHALVGILVEGAERGRFDRFVPVTLIARVWPRLPLPWLMTGADPREARSHFTRHSSGWSIADRTGAGPYVRVITVRYHSLRAWFRRMADFGLWMSPQNPYKSAAGGPQKLHVQNGITRHKTARPLTWPC
jgi:hypothetical protein